MKKAVLLLTLAILQISLHAADDLDSNSINSKQAKKSEQRVDEETKDTLAAFFQKPELNDIPSPKGFLMLKESFVHVASSFRYGEVYLEGDLVIDDTQVFFVKQMELAGWAKGELNKTDKTFLKFTKYQLVFQKGRDRCVINIGKNNNGKKTVVLIDLKPLSLQ